jgi:hypothetical protein
VYGWEADHSQVVLVANPAAGAGFTYGLPQSEDSLVRLVTFKLVTDSNAATRQVYLDFLGGDSTPIGRFEPPYTQAASKTVQYTFGVDLNVYGANDGPSIGTPLAPVILRKGESLVVSITNKQVGDQVSNIRVTLDQRGAIVPE